MTLHAIADTSNIGKWAAVRLSDGSSDNVVYDRRADAIRGQKHNEKYFAFCQIHPGGMQPKEAEVFLDYHRKLYDAGFRLPDPDFQMPAMPITAHDRVLQRKALTTKRR